jgi:hypothetical protein
MTPNFPRFLVAAAGTLILLASGQVFASTVVVAPATVYARPPVVVTTAPSVVVKPAPKVVVASAPLPTVVVRPTPVPRTVYVASRPVYVVR